MRLINADDLKKDILAWTNVGLVVLPNDDMVHHGFAMADIIDGINKQPTISFTHSHWNQKQDFIYAGDQAILTDNFYCSACNKASNYTYNFCPYCGVKMDLENENI